MQQPRPRTIRSSSSACSTVVPPDQLLNFVRAGIILQARQLAASAAARLCDRPDGPTAIGYGGARGGGKTHWLLAQMGADDCQRVPGLKCLLLRKVGKSNLENFEDLRQRLFPRLPHEFNASRGILTFANGSRIILGHYQCEKDIDSYLGLEYDVIGIEEATQLTARKYEDISTCCRTSKPDWRPRIYSTTNPGGIGHQWYFDKFILPHQCGTESATRFIPARVDDNAFINPEYKSTLASRTGWQYAAWYQGQWNFPAGQYFNNFRPEIHVLPDSFNENIAVEWVASMDYGYTHPSVVLLGCFDHAGNLYVLDEHAERYWIPQRHAQAVKTMLARHFVYGSQDHLRESLLARLPGPFHRARSPLARAPAPHARPLRRRHRHVQQRKQRRFGRQTIPRPRAHPAPRQHGPRVRLVRHPPAVRRPRRRHQTHPLHSQTLQTPARMPPLLAA